MASSRAVRIGMLGFGVVGQGVYRMLEANREAIERKTGALIEITKIGVRDPHKHRSVSSELLTTDLSSLVADPRIDVVLELMGGVEPAESLIRESLAQRKHVVTANKELMAKAGPELLESASEQGLDLHFEAAVGGGIPLIQPLKHQLSGNDVLKIMGIVNGTTNFILTKMAEDGEDFDAALVLAQAAGFAEAEPSADIDGLDARYKIAILSSIAFGGAVHPDDVFCEGIRGVTKRDMDVAALLGYRIKLLAIAELVADSEGNERVRCRVHPTLIPKEHPLASVSGVYNAVWLKGDFVGDIMLSGKGAGGDPTASAVVGDIIDVARNLLLGGSGNAGLSTHRVRPIPIDDLSVRYYIRLIVKDQPRVLGDVATLFGNHEISLSATEMREIDGTIGEIVLLTHCCREADFQRARGALDESVGVLEVGATLRVEEEF